MTDYRLPNIPRGCFLVIRTDGSEDIHRFPDKKGLARHEALAQVLRFDEFDFVTLTKSGRYQADLVMIVNDFGYETKTVEHNPGHIELVPVEPRFPINDKATELYWTVCKPGTTHRIVGDVAVLHDAD